MIVVVDDLWVGHFCEIFIVEVNTLEPNVQQSADVDPTATVKSGSTVWHLAQIRNDAVIGENVIIGRGAYVGSGVTVGKNSKIQNYALVYEPATLADGVFIGPAAVLTNDLFPRAMNPDHSLKDASDWEAVGVTIETGASVGARAVCIAPVTLGEWSTVAAGAVVTRDVPAFALVAGVPAKRIGWVGKSGQPLEQTEDNIWKDPATGDLFREEDGLLKEVENG